MIKSQIELLLKQSNRKSENDFIDLDQLRPEFALKLTPEVKTMVAHFKKIVHQYVKLHNAYCRMKIGEEKAKAKKPKTADDQKLATKYEHISFESEMSRVAKEMAKNVPEDCQVELQTRHLNPLLGLKATQGKPKLGSVWHVVSLWPTVVPGPQAAKRSNSQKSAQAATRR